MPREKLLPVTGEVCPHHFILTADEILEDDGNYKMVYRLQGRRRGSVRRGLADGTMDVISTDHAPHSEEEKNRSMAKAAFGIVGLNIWCYLYGACEDGNFVCDADGRDELQSGADSGLSDKGAVAEREEGRFGDF